MDHQELPTSGIPRIPRPVPMGNTIELSEMSASTQNSKQGSMLPPPQAGLKRKIQPDAGVGLPRPAPAPPRPRAGTSTVKGISMPNAARHNSSSSSSSSRALSSMSSRAASNSSFASSVGSGRTPLSHGHRPQTSMGHSKSRSMYAPSRPASSFERPGYVAAATQLEESNNNWDVRSHVDNVESMHNDLKAFMSDSTAQATVLKETLAVYKERINELEEARTQSIKDNAVLEAEIQRYKMEVSNLSMLLDDWKRKYNSEVTDTNKSLDEMRRGHSSEVDDLLKQHRRELNQSREEADMEVRRRERAHEEEASSLKRKMEGMLEDERQQKRKEVQKLSEEGSLAQQKVAIDLQAKEHVIQSLQGELEQAKLANAREKDAVQDVRGKLADAASAATTAEATIRSLRAQVEFLESDSKSQSNSFADLERRTQEAERQAEEAMNKLRSEETLRRKLHNQVQELKGNIRVFCRVRPVLQTDEADRAQINFPDAGGDSQELDILGPEEKSSLGKVTTKNNAFKFDHVFDPSSQNGAVFDEISQLVQSALDGFNVCIFCYGQTGSGKTFTMSSDDGMIPRAVNQIYDTAQSLEEKGWKYSMAGSFVEVYNENINDLLGRAEDFDKKKHEIRHDMERSKTTITDVTEVSLDSPGRVEQVLRKAMNNRSVAATKANERSSRSHSVFILKLLGENGMTGEKSEGTLNLVDLAGSERLSHSGATGDRLKETQSINKSLSCLGDVIGALGQGREGAHIPYRNSKLTYLLQFSLGGNSKTLMFVMVSPFHAHLGETLTSLKFATKVHNTHIGTAKRQAKA